MKTTEIKVFSPDKTLLMEFLSEQGLTQFVEASYDELNHSEFEVEGLMAQFSEDINDNNDIPLTFYASSKEEMRHIVSILQLFEGSCRWETSTYPSIVWQQAWEDEIENFHCGPFHIITKQSNKEICEENQIIIDPADAFGSGQHATTKVILDQLITNYKESDRSLLDVGCGTGILAIVAEKLGISHVVATDIDEKAIAATSHNRQVNHCVFQLHQGTFPDETMKFDLIVSNILPPVINDLLKDFKQRLASSGRIIIAGFNESNLKKIMKDVDSLGLTLINQGERRGWLALTLSSES